MDKAELQTLFELELEGLKERDPIRGRLVEAEIETWAGIVPVDPEKSTWDRLYRQIQCRAEVHRISEEQAIHNLFDPESAQCFLMLRSG